jgi:MraZ protein
MINLIGEYECKLDAKGRIMLPSGLKKQMPEGSEGKYVINRGFEKCLILYPENIWNKISEEINRLNPYVKKNRDFIRYFYRGATELQLDGAGRLLFPRALLEYADADKDLVLFAHGDRIEVWNKKLYDELLHVASDDFSSLAEEVMGPLGNQEKAQGDVP